MVNNDNLIISSEKELSIIVSIGCVALANMPYVKSVCDKFGVTKPQYEYLKLRFIHNPRQSLEECLKALNENKGGNVRYG